MYTLITKKSIVESCVFALANSEDPIHRRLSLLILFFLLRESDFSIDIVLATEKALKEDPVVEVRRHAAWLLRYLRDKSLYLATAALADADLGVRFEAVEALAVLAETYIEDNDHNSNDNDNDDDDDDDDDCTEKEHDINKNAIAGLLKALGDNQPEVSLRAAFHLSTLNPSAVQLKINEMFPECTKPKELFV